ncbi:MAG TPA: hypothetical protein DER56_03025, partial [Thermosipho africanus]|nr:hypothetical protein [Thermosipho africanus]
TVTLPDSDIELELLNKSNDKLAEGDDVYILSPTGDLTNSFILATFGESTRLVAGEDIDIAANTITAGEIAAGAITADELAANSVTAMKIKAGEITTDHVSSNFGETLDISSNSSISLQITQQDIDAATNDIKNNIVSYINLSSESADIYADKINLTGYCTFTTAQSLANTAESNATTAGYNYAMGVKNGLATSGYTTIHGGNITTSSITASKIATGTITADKIALTGLLNGYSSGVSNGFSINSSGIITIPYAAPLNWSSGSSIRGNLQAYGGFSIDASTSDINLNCGSSYYSKIYNMRATSQPYNIPMTTTSSSTKITEIAHFSTYLNVTCNGSNYGVYYTVSDKRLKTDIKASKINALDRINSTKIRDFNWIKDGSNVDCGVIAQEVEQDVGERYVLKVPQPNGGVNYQVNSYEFMPLLVKGIQELNQKHEEKTVQLTNEIAILKLMLEQQQQQIDELKALVA